MEVTGTILDKVIIITAALAAIGLLLVGSSLIWRILFSYQITDKDIRVLLFRAVPIYRIPFRKIKELHQAPLYEVALVPGMHLFTRPFARRVVIEMRDTLVMFAFLTPMTRRTVTL
jgi:hypothetical protein